MMRNFSAACVCGVFLFASANPSVGAERGEFAKEGELFRKGDFDGLIESITARLKENPNDASAFSNRGMARAAKGDRAGALADYDRAIELDPNLAAVYNHRGITKGMKGDFDGAIADFSRALEIQPDYASAFSNRGRARFARLDIDGAIEDYNRGDQQVAVPADWLTNARAKE